MQSQGDPGRVFVNGSEQVSDKQSAWCITLHGNTQKMTNQCHHLSQIFKKTQTTATENTCPNMMMFCQAVKVHKCTILGVCIVFIIRIPSLGGGGGKVKTIGGTAALGFFGELIGEDKG